MEHSWPKAIKAVFLANNDGLGSLASALETAGATVKVVDPKDRVPGDANFYILGQNHQNGAGSSIHEGHLKQMNPGAVVFCLGPNRIFRDLAEIYGLITEEPHLDHGREVDYASFILQRMALWTDPETSYGVKATDYPEE